MNFGVIGYGYWGPNVVRNLASLEGSQVAAIAEMSPAAQKRAHKAYPGMHITADAMEVITSPNIDAIAVITPVWTHYELAKAALENGKHVFVEKPFTSNVAQGEKLIDLAIQKNLRVMVDHTFLFTGAVRKISQLLREGALGKLYYYDSTASTWDCFSMTSMSCGISRRTTFPSWITSLREVRKRWWPLVRAI